MSGIRIAQVAPLFESVPPRLYGGTERVVAWLTEELTRRGHHVTLFASGDSRTAARLVASSGRALRLDPARPDVLAAHVRQAGEVLARRDAFDVIHAHIDGLGFLLGRASGLPAVHTMHGRLDLPSILELFATFPEAPLVSISDAQRRPAAGMGLRWVATVPHGLPLDTIPCDPARGGGGGYLAFLGRLSPEKRPDLAVAIARRLGIPLRIAAKVDPSERAYFEREIAPLLADPLVEYVGEIEDAAKWAFLADALCLLFPIDWPEPFGLAMIEAMACGTPVVARPCGSVPEVVADGVTGFVAETEDDLVAAVKRVDVIDRARCRRHVEERFSVRVMADRYEAVYRALA
jgi:glycosyltransferase involved in cell wall biosynthesis